MQLDAKHVRSDTLFSYYVSLSILHGETLHIIEPTKEMVEILTVLTPLLQAETKGLGIDTLETYFTPIKIRKNFVLDLQGRDLLTVMRCLLPAFTFCGETVKLQCVNFTFENESIYYLRDVLLSELSVLLTKYSCSLDPTTHTVSLVVQGKRLLEQAPPYVVKNQPELVAIRGEIHTPEESTVELIKLQLKDLRVPMRLRHSFTKETSLLHLNGLYGTHEGYDNDFSYIVYEDAHHTIDLTQSIQSFRKKITQGQLSQELIEDLLLIIGLVGGELPCVYEETSYLLEELNAQTPFEIKEKNGFYHSLKASSNSLSSKTSTS